MFIYIYINTYIYDEDIGDEDLEKGKISHENSYPKTKNNKYTHPSKEKRALQPVVIVKGYGKTTNIV